MEPRKPARETDQTVYIHGRRHDARMAWDHGWKPDTADSDVNTHRRWRRDPWWGRPVMWLIRVTYRVLWSWR